MVKNKTADTKNRSAASSVLTPRDAEIYHAAVNDYAKKATSSKKKAQTTLKSIGIHTATGRISRKYG